ncbi:hypothetical protein AAHH80_36730, partial [Burkholderia pseudomallei]
MTARKKKVAKGPTIHNVQHKKKQIDGISHNNNHQPTPHLTDQAYNAQLIPTDATHHQQQQDQHNTELKQNPSHN